MKFDKKKFLKLLREQEQVKKKGELLTNFTEAKKDELTKYKIWIDDQIFWESRENYLQILKQFVNKEIDGEQFRKQFCHLRSSNMTASEMLTKKFEDEALDVSLQSTETNIQINPKSYKFGRKISTIFYLLDLYDPDLTFEQDLSSLEIFPDALMYAMSEESLRLMIKDIDLPEVKKYCNDF